MKFNDLKEMNKGGKEILTQPKGPSTQPLGSFTQPLGKIIQPLGSSTQPLCSFIQPQGKIILPWGSSTRPNGSFIQPWGKVILSLGSSTQPKGRFDKPKGWITRPSVVEIFLWSWIIIFTVFAERLKVWLFWSEVYKDFMRDYSVHYNLNFNGYLKKKGWSEVTP